MTDELERIARAYRGYEEESLATKRWSLANRGNRAALDERQRTIRKMLAARGWLPLGSRRVLEVGCGTGAELARLLEFGAEPQRLVGVDLLAERVAAAKAAFPALDLRVANAEHLEFSDGEFDLVVAMTLFSSIRDADMARNVAAEIQRVLRPGGAVLWYDFRYDNPRNPNVHGMNEAAIRSLFPGLSGPLAAVTLLPPLARRLGPLTPALYPVLAFAPPLRTHLVGLLSLPHRGGPGSLSLPPSGGGPGRGARDEIRLPEPFSADDRRGGDRRGREDPEVGVDHHRPPGRAPLPPPIGGRAGEPLPPPIGGRAGERGVS